MFGNRYRYVFILLLAVYSYLNILFTEGYRLFGVELSPWIFFGSLLAMVLLIWESNHLLESKVSHSARLHPLIIQFGLSLLAVILISLLFTWIFPVLTGHETAPQLTFKLALGFGFRVNLFLHCVNAIVFFMSQSKRNEIEKESLLKQTAEARFEALRNQVNPHFLFNSFNVLSSLVHKDAETASRFIEQLSAVYRYVLNNQTNNVVRLRDELEFLESYIYLLKIRFGDSITIDNELQAGEDEQFIAPATLQMLIENAIKHNVVSKARPLNIHLFRDGEYFVVENILQLKAVKEVSTETGLNNIRERYAFLCQDDAVIVRSNGKFVVKIPVLKVAYEYSDR